MADKDYRIFVHSPADLARECLDWAERARSDPGIPFGIPAIDKVVIPMKPGELISIIARPGHGKTSLMAYLARAEAKRLQATGDNSQVVVYVTWEQSAEELETMFQASKDYSVSDIAWGRANLEAMKRHAVKRAAMPIWVIGHGIGRAGQKMPRMTVDVVLGAIETMKADYGVTPRLMLFDYMQLVPVARARDRIQQVTEAPIRIKELALRIGAPAVVGVQASREVDRRDEKIPRMDDAQWSSAIEQTSDKVFGLWRPCQTEPPNSPPVLLGDREFEINERLLIMRLLKQRGDQGRHTWALYFAPEYLKLAELETRHTELEF